MKILQINKFYHPLIGGVETVVKQYAEFLAEKGNMVAVLTAHDSFSLFSKVEEINTVKVIRCGSLGTYFSMPVSFSFFCAFLKIRKQYDVFHFHEPFPLGSLLAWLLPSGAKVAVTWHSDIVRQGFLKKGIQRFQKKLCRRADIIFTTSARLAEFSEILPAFKEKIQVFPLTIDADDYPGEENSPVTLPELPSKYIFFMGRFSYYKGIDVLIEAMKFERLKNVHLVLAGDGPLKEKIKSSTRDMDNILFLNRFISEQEKRFLLQEAEAFLFPSTLPSEAFGIIQLEAMIYGTPVINTDLPTGVPWVSLHNESGLTVSTGDPESLAGAIEKIYSDSELRERLSVGAKKRVKALFTSDGVLSRLPELYGVEAD